MKNRISAAVIILLALAFLSCDGKKAVADPAPEPPKAEAVADVRPVSNKLKFATSMGAFTLQLLPDVAPETVENFKQRIRDSHYPGTIFHRVRPDFMAQGGGYLPDMSAKNFKGAVTNEADLAMSKGLTNKRGTISMAYVPGNPFGAGVQFFINVKNNPHLNFKAKTLGDYGHCPFGKVVQGMEVVDRISKAKTHTIGKFSDVPIQPITILSVEEID